MMTIRRSSERGFADHGWLQARHTFSFADYYDPKQMGVSALRVINDDRIAPDSGFPTHPHSDMEIITYIKRGTIEHRDSMGHAQQIHAGEVQHMSAGSGITHSEYNPSPTEPLELLQIWIEPSEQGIEPHYQQQRFEPQPGWVLIASGDGREGSLRIHQEASLYRLTLQGGISDRYPMDSGRTLYLHILSGTVEIGGDTLEAADGATIQQQSEVDFYSKAGGELLLFDLP